MAKKVLRIVCTVSGVLSGILALLFCWNVALGMERINTGMSIIGGADAPTLSMIAHQVVQDAPIFGWMIPVFAVFLGTLTALAVQRARKK